MVEEGSIDFEKVNRIKTFLNSHRIKGKFKIRYLLSALIIFISLMLLNILGQVRYLGDSILMLKQVCNELARFSMAFGGIIIVFLVVGRLLFKLI